MSDGAYSTTAMTSDEAIELVERHGVLLESARGLVPNLAEMVAGAAIQGSWWGHPLANEIFVLTRAVRNCDDVLICRLVEGKITYVHRRLWPALARLADQLDAGRLAAVRDVHTFRGSHKAEVTAFATWVSEDVKQAASRLNTADAVAALGPFLTGA